MWRTVRIVALCSAAAGATAANAEAPSAPGALEGERLIAGPFWVDAVDRTIRTITVRAPDGAQMTLDVAPNVTGFEGVKAGDRVDIDYDQSRVVALRPARGTSAEAVEPTAARLPNPSQASGPSGAGGQADVGRANAAGNGRSVTAVVQLTAVDPARGTIQFAGAGGTLRTLKVRDQVLHRQLRSLKPGDRVTVIYTEPVATSIRPTTSR